MDRIVLMRHVPVWAEREDATGTEAFPWMLSVPAATRHTIVYLKDWADAVATMNTRDGRFAVYGWERIARHAAIEPHATISRRFLWRCLECNGLTENPAEHGDMHACNARIVLGLGQEMPPHYRVPNPRVTTTYEPGDDQ